MPGPVSTGMGDHVQVGKPLQFVTSHSGELSLLPPAGRKMSTSQSVVTLCGLQQMQVRFITFRMRHSQGEMYIGHGRQCVCLFVCCHIPMLLHGPGCKLWEW